jgi:hypothetical protein
MKPPLGERGDAEYREIIYICQSNLVNFSEDLESGCAKTKRVTDRADSLNINKLVLCQLALNGKCN